MRVAPAAVSAPAAPRTPTPTGKAADPILAIARRIEMIRPNGSDLAILARAADRGDTRALELLAWCKLKGIGTPRDAMTAYELYGEAATAGVPHAAANQRLVFERSLTSAERQHLLERAAGAANSPQALAQPPAAVLR